MKTGQRIFFYPLTCGRIYWIVATVENPLLTSPMDVAQKELQRVEKIVCLPEAMKETKEFRRIEPSLF